MGNDISSGKLLTALLTAREVAEQLRISTRTLWTLTARGQLPAVRIGRAVRYRPSDLAAYCERQIGGQANG